MRILKIMLHFLCIMLIMALLASVVTNISNAIFGHVKLNNNTNIFERLGADALNYAVISLTSFFCVVMLLLWLLQLRFRVKLIYITLLSGAIGVAFSYLTKRSAWSWGIHHTSELSYMVVVSVCMLLFPLINKKLWDVFKKQVTLLQNILYFLLLLLAMAAVASMLTTVGDYILCAIYGGGCARQNVFQRLGFYFLYYFFFSFVSFFFLAIILLSVLQLKFRFKTVYLLVVGALSGFYFSYLTKGLIMSLYIHNPEKRIRYMIVVTICMILFPFINKKLWELFNKKKKQEIS